MKEKYLGLELKDTQFCAEQLKSTIFVFQLSSLLGAENSDPGGFMKKINSRFNLIHILPCIG